MKNLLVPFDFSVPSANAFLFALKVAGQSGGTVHVYHVVEIPRIPNTMLSPARMLEEPLFKEVAKKVQAKIAKLVAQEKAQSVKVITTIDVGVTLKKILKYPAENPCDMIILGSHGARGLREYFLGSNAEKIIRTSPVPVLVVKGAPSGMVKNIVFPNTLDTQHQTELIQRVKALQKFFGAHLHIVYINTPDNFTSDKFTHERLEAFVKKFSFKDFTTSIYNHHFEDEGIIQFTEKAGAEMIAMGTHGHKGLSHFVTGSMAEDVTNHVKAMIWTFVTKPRSKK